MRSPAVAFIALVLCSTTAAAQQILRVDASGAGGAYTDIQPAIDAANEGDLVLVASGTYSSFVVQSKSIHVVGDMGTKPVIGGTMRVESIGASQTVALVRLHQYAFALSTEAIAVDSCAGKVFIQDCVSEDTPSTLVHSPGSLSVMNSSQVFIDGSRIQAFPQAYDPGIGLGLLFSAQPLHIENSSVFASSSTFVGSPAVADPFQGVLALGTPGAHVIGSTVNFVNSTIVGGAGSFGYAVDAGRFGGAVCAPQLEGQPGILMESGNSSPEITANGCLISGGLMGPSHMITTGAGAPLTCTGGSAASSAEDVQAGNLTTASNPRYYFGTPVIRVGEKKTINFRGEPFEFIFVVYSLDSSTLINMPAVTGPIPIGPNQVLIYEGMTNQFGKAKRTLTLNETGVDFIGLFEQALFYSLATGFTASNPRFVAVLGNGTP